MLVLASKLLPHRPRQPELFCSPPVPSVQEHLLKFIVPGGLITWYLDSHNAFWRVVAGHVYGSSLARTSALIALALAALTVVLFLYILFMPFIRGEQPDFRHWRRSGVLSTVIPILTAAIVSGWTCLAYTLSRYARMGYIEGSIAASGLYAFLFGLMGLIPAPKVYRRT